MAELKITHSNRGDEAPIDAFIYGLATGLGVAGGYALVLAVLVLVLFSNDDTGATSPATQEETSQ